MQWTQRHRTAAWVITILAVALLWIAARDTGMPRHLPETSVLPALLVLAAVFVVLWAVLTSRRARK